MARSEARQLCNGRAPEDTAHSFAFGYCIVGRGRLNRATTTTLWNTNQMVANRRFVSGKLHGIRITGADLNYHGSITLDPDHCEEVGILPLEFVDIWNKNSGARLSTYVLYGDRGSRCCILNGAAARTCQIGDEVIVCSSITMDGQELVQHRPRVLIFESDNRIIERLSYVVAVDQMGGHTMTICEDHT
jgi:aspartate 1-decarboxylase